MSPFNIKQLATRWGDTSSACWLNSWQNQINRSSGTKSHSYNYSTYETLLWESFILSVFCDVPVNCDVTAHMHKHVLMSHKSLAVTEPALSQTKNSSSVLSRSLLTNGMLLSVSLFFARWRGKLLTCLITLVFIDCGCSQWLSAASAFWPPLCCLRCSSSSLWCSTLWPDQGSVSVTYLLFPTTITITTICTCSPLSVSTLPSQIPFCTAQVTFQMNSQPTSHRQDGLFPSGQSSTSFWHLWWSTCSLASVESELFSKN